MSSSAALFKFALIAGIVVLLIIASVSTLACKRVEDTITQKNIEAFYAVSSSYSTVKLNPDIKTYWQATPGSDQDKINKLLFKALNESFPFSKLLDVTSFQLSESDVFVIANDEEALKNIGIPKASPLGNDNDNKPSSKIPTPSGPSTQACDPSSSPESKSDEDYGFLSLEKIARPVQSSEYLGDDSRSCSTISQIWNPESASSRIKVRVLDSYYSVCSTCFRVQASSIDKGKLSLVGSQSSAVINMLCPFAISSYALYGTHAMHRVVDITYSSADNSFGFILSETDANSNKTKVLKFDQTTPTKFNYIPASIVAYYLDYIGPIMDVTQQGRQPGFTVGVATFVDHHQGIVGFKTSLQNPFNNPAMPDKAKFAFSTFPSVSGGSTSFNRATTKVYPGIVNPARIAVEFGYVFNTTSVNKISSKGEKETNLNDFMMQFKKHDAIDNSNGDKDIVPIRCNAYPTDERSKQYAVVPQDTLNSCYFKR